MQCLNFERLEAVSAEAFHSQRPFPWVNPVGLLHPEAHEELVNSLPDTSLFERKVGVPRKFGQRSHDRYNLEYEPGIPLSKAWRQFIEELKGEQYRDFVEHLFGRGSLRLRFHWHYADSGCSVSPHCDSGQKVGSHLFYMNSSESWNSSWGGATLVLDDGGRIHRSSSPSFSDFDSEVASEFMDNASFIFERGDHSWHGVKEIHCPQGAMRRLFIVVVDGWRWAERIRTRLLRPGVVGY
jgi:hypothetical protein